MVLLWLGMLAPAAYRLPKFDSNQEEGLNPPVHNRSAPLHVPHEALGMHSVRVNFQYKEFRGLLRTSYLLPGHPVLY